MAVKFSTRPSLEKPARRLITFMAVKFSTRPSLEKPARRLITFLLQPAWLPPLPSVDVTANLPGYIILSGYQHSPANMNLYGMDNFG